MLWRYCWRYWGCQMFRRDMCGCKQDSTACWHGGARGVGDAVPGQTGSPALAESSPRAPSSSCTLRSSVSMVECHFMASAASFPESLFSASSTCGAACQDCTRMCVWENHKMSLLWASVVQQERL